MSRLCRRLSPPVGLALVFAMGSVVAADDGAAGKPAPRVNAVVDSAAAELEGPNRTIQMLLQMNAGAPGLESGERLRGSVPDDAAARRGALSSAVQGAAPPLPAALGSRAPERPTTGAAPAGSPAPATAAAQAGPRPQDWLQGGAPVSQDRSAAAEAEMARAGEASAAMRSPADVPVRRDAGDAVAPDVGAWLPIAWLRYLREHREWVLGASVALLAMLGAGTFFGARAQQGARSGGRGHRGVAGASRGAAGSARGAGAARPVKPAGRGGSRRR